MKAARTEYHTYSGVKKTSRFSCDWLATGGDGVTSGGPILRDRSGTRLGADDGAPINFPGKYEGDFAGSNGGGNLVIRKELSRGVACGEGNLNFLPDGVKTISRNGINHRDERLASGQAGIRLVNEVERTVVLQECFFRGGRE